MEQELSTSGDRRLDPASGDRVAGLMRRLSHRASVLTILALSFAFWSGAILLLERIVN